jgi:transcriptional regulator with XRE-family HTH domain
MSEENTLLLNIKRFRKEQGLTQADLAEKMGKSVSHLRQVESSQVPPSYQLIQSVSEALNVSIMELYTPHDTVEEAVSLSEDSLSAAFINLASHPEVMVRLAKLAPNSRAWDTVLGFLKLEEEHEESKKDLSKKSKKA